jgi:hypothetical protein
MRDFHPNTVSRGVCCTAADHFLGTKNQRFRPSTLAGHLFGHLFEFSMPTPLISIVQEKASISTFGHFILYSNFRPFI